VSLEISIERRSDGVKRLRAVDGSPALACSDHSIVQVFEITGLDRMIPMHRTLDDALLLTPVAA
jgi:hypothetical protein